MTGKIEIVRRFDSPLDRVWKAWTEPELVKQWWGPEGFTAPSIEIDLRVGGKYIYAMRGPEGSEWDKNMYIAGIYKEITPPEAHNSSKQARLVMTDYFSDERGDKIDPTMAGMDKAMPDEMEVIVQFEAIEDDRTELTIDYPQPDSEVQFQAMKDSEMEEGWQSSLNKLAEVVEGG